MATKPYEVDVGGVTYDVDAPDEATAWRWANIEHNKPENRIPGAIKQPTRPQTSFWRGDASKSVLGNIAQAGSDIGSLASEVPISLATGVASGIIAPLTSFATRVSGGDEYQADKAFKEALQRYTYQPRNEMAQEAVSAIGEALAPLVGVPIPTLNALGRAAPPAINALKARATTAIPDVTNMLRRPAAEPMVGMGAASTELPIQRQTIAESARIPLKLSKGQLTRNLEQQQFEHETGKTYPSAEGKPLLLQQQKVNEDFLRNFDASAEAMGGEIFGETQLVPIGKVVDAPLVKRFKEAKAEVKKKYDAADAAGETQEQVSINPLIKYIADHETEIATNNAPVLANLKMQLAKLGAADTLSIYDLEQLRKSANKISFPGSGVNEVYMGELRPLFEGITEGKGGDLYKAARAENTKFANEFKDHAIISKLLRNKPGTKDRAVAFEDIYNHVVHSGSADDLKLVQNTLLKAGDEGEFAWNQIRAQAANELKQRALSNISKDAAGNPIPNAKALRTATAQLDRDGKLDLLFGKDEAKRVRELVQLGGDIYSPVPGTISPGTASVLIRSLDAIAKNAVISRIPVVRSVASGAAEMAAKKAREKRVSEAVNYNALNKNQ
tara:strand:- start:36 stop:1877 length:1842 start_codon:yes stop_codon:yes gene_type:complete